MFTEKSSKQVTLCETSGDAFNAPGDDQRCANLMLRKIAELFLNSAEHQFQRNQITIRLEWKKNTESACNTRQVATSEYKEPSLCAHWVAHRTTPIPLHQPMSSTVVMSGISKNKLKNEAQATLVLRTECKKQVICVPGAKAYNLY